MKNILKYLTIAGVLILFLPFFRMCQRPAEKVETMDSVVEVIDTTHSSSNNIQVYKDSVYSTDNIEQENTDLPIIRILNSIKNTFDTDGSISGFQLGLSIPSLIFSKEKIDKIDKTFFSFIFFFLILINSFLIVLFSFFKRKNIIWLLASLNVIMLIVSYILLDVSFDEIKYGSYLFVINSILIIYFAIKHKKLIKT